MKPPISADVRAEILRLRGERLTYREIGGLLHVHETTVGMICRCYFDDAVKRAAAELKREINLARAEAHTAPLFHPERWA
jgi:DNA-directed RNA polymerase specialized sigma24 family protein